jgi:hypothetical protein
VTVTRRSRPIAGAVPDENFAETLVDAVLRGAAAG